LLPLVPPAAILCGRQLARWSEHLTSLTLLAGVWSAAVVFLLAFYLYEWRIRSRSEAVQFTQDSAAMSQEILRDLGPSSPIAFVDASILFQMHLKTFQFQTPTRRAATLLRREEPVFLLVQDLRSLQRALGSNSVPLFTLAQTPPGHFQTRLISNRPRPQ